MLDTDFMSDQQIAASFLSYLNSDGKAFAEFELMPIPLSGGFNARLYRYKLVGDDLRVLRILRSEHQEQDLLYQQFVHKTLNNHGLMLPLIHHICGEKSHLGGVFAIMDFVPGQILSELSPELHGRFLGESMAAMHDMDVNPIINSFRSAGIQDKQFLNPAYEQSMLYFFEQKTPWASELILWLRDHLPLDGQELAVIHGDFHGNNLVYENGALSGVLDWTFRISDPAVDLAHMLNAYLVFAPQFDSYPQPYLLDRIVDGALKAYQVFRSLDYYRVNAFRALHLLGAFSSGVAGLGPDFMRKSQSQNDYLLAIPQMTGISLSP